MIVVVLLLVFALGCSLVETLYNIRPERQKASHHPPPFPRLPAPTYDISQITRMHTLRGEPLEMAKDKERKE